MPEISSRTLGSAAVGIAFASTVAYSTVVITDSFVPTLLLPPPSTPSTKANDTSQESKDRRPVTSSSHLARQWKSLYDWGKKAGPRNGVMSAVSFAYAAYTMRQGNTRNKETRCGLLVAAALLDIAIVPYTLIFMKDVNAALSKQANAAEKKQDDGDVRDEDMLQAGVPVTQTENLFRQWARLNLVRGLIVDVGILCAIAALTI